MANLPSRSLKIHFTGQEYKALEYVTKHYDQSGKPLSQVCHQLVMLTVEAGLREIAREKKNAEAATVNDTGTTTAVREPESSDTGAVEGQTEPNPVS